MKKQYISPELEIIIMDNYDCIIMSTFGTDSANLDEDEDLLESKFFDSLCYPEYESYKKEKIKRI